MNEGLANRIGPKLAFQRISSQDNPLRKAISVQKIGWILAVLLGICWLATEIPSPLGDRKAPAQEQVLWRRTVQGWERIDDWTFVVEKTPPALHPGIFSLLMVTLSLSAGITSKASKEG
jgi:hypothetical protein